MAWHIRTWQNDPARTNTLLILSQGSIHDDIIDDLGISIPHCSLMNRDAETIARIQGLQIHFGSLSKPVRAVDGLDLDIRAGETLALVGESGCGKSVTAMSLARLVPEPPARYTGGRVLWRGRDVLAMSQSELRALRGNEIAYIFQDPSASLNPVFRVGYQIGESIRLHRPGVNAKHETLELLERVGLPDPQRAARAYPHQLSGGMQQRAMIAMALACQPKLLVADEPTTALDVTIQAQILDLLADLQRELGMAILLITHNLGLVATIAHRISIMYAGHVVESGETKAVLRHPRHPYTKGLLNAVPSLSGDIGRLTGMEGSVPNPAHLPSGCRFHPRCPMRQSICEQQAPDFATVHDGHDSRCHFWSDL